MSNSNLKEMKMTDDTKLALLEHIVAQNKNQLDSIDAKLCSINNNLGSMRSELNAEFKDVRSKHSDDHKEILEDITQFKMELADEFKELRKDQTFYRADTKDEFKVLRSEMASQLKWILGVMLTLFSGIYATMIGQIVAKVFHFHV